MSIPLDTHLKIGGMIFPNMDQCDFTGPFEALARVPNSTFMTIWKDKQPVRDLAGMQLLADTSFDEAPQLDVLLVPGGHGQEALMHDEAVLAFIRTQAAGARYVFSVCTGALLCGAAGLLHGKRATTHWTAMEVLPLYGATPSDERVVVDGKFVSAGGVTSGIDGSLIVVALLRDRFQATLTLDEIAAENSVSADYLAREFRRRFGCTVGGYVRRLRIDFACEQLAAGRESLAGIAEAAGFADQSHFTRVFRRKMGVTPGAYRAQFAAGRFHSKN